MNEKGWGSVSRHREEPKTILPATIWTHTYLIQHQHQMHVLEDLVLAYGREELERVVDAVDFWVFFEVLS